MRAGRDERRGRRDPLDKAGQSKELGLQKKAEQRLGSLSYRPVFGSQYGTHEPKLPIPSQTIKQRRTESLL
jgi:hypothetical protein